MLPFSLMSEVYVVLGWPTPLPQLQEGARDPAWAVNVEGLVQRWAAGHMAQPRLSKPASPGCVRTFGERACFLLTLLSWWNASLSGIGGHCPWRRGHKGSQNQTCRETASWGPWALGPAEPGLSGLWLSCSSSVSGRVPGLLGLWLMSLSCLFCWDPAHKGETVRPPHRPAELVWLRFQRAGSAWVGAFLPANACAPRLIVKQIRCGWSRLHVRSCYLSLPSQMTKALAFSFRNLPMVWDFAHWLPERQMLLLTSDVHAHEVQPTCKLLHSKWTCSESNRPASSCFNCTERLHCGETARGEVMTSIIPHNVPQPRTAPDYPRNLSSLMCPLFIYLLVGLLLLLPGRAAWPLV